MYVMVWRIINEYVSYGVMNIYRVVITLYKIELDKIICWYL